MDMQMTVENSVFSRPSLFFRAPQCTEAHVDHAGAAAFPFKTAGRMKFNMAGSDYLWIGADGDFPQIK